MYKYSMKPAQPAPPAKFAKPPADASAAKAAARAAVNTTPQGCTNFKLRQLARNVSRLYDTQMAAIGLKTTQYSLLSHVLQLGPIAPSDLAQRMGMDASTLTRNLRPLVEHGWCEQGPGADARSRSISITPAGKLKRAEALTHWKRAQLTLNERLGADTVVALHALIDQVQATLAEAEEA
jgi:DNA-binding MarR family transcriptional regulator